MENKTENLPIKIYGEPILREKASKVDKIEEDDLRIIEKMIDAMFANEGIGLAAPQIGIGKQIIVARDDTDIIKLINPVILKKEGEEEAKEGCLSLPDIYVDVKRATCISVEGRNENWETVIIEATGLTARILQHEIDHLNGVLIIDYASPVSEVLVKQQLKKLRRL